MSAISSSSGWARRSPLVGLVLFLGAIAATFLLMQRGSQSISFDAVHGILAAEQYLGGLSRSPQVAVTPTLHDLALDDQDRITWWPPSYQLGPLVVRAVSDLSLGKSVRLVVLLSWLATIAGWGFYFRGLLQRSVLPYVMALFVCYWYVTANASAYDGGEALICAVVPWVVLWTLYAQERRSASAAFGSSLATVLLFAVKYSAIFVILAVAATWLIEVITRRVGKKVWAFAGGGAALGLALLALAEIPGGMTPGSYVGSTVWAAPLDLFGVAFAMTDLDRVHNWLIARSSAAIQGPGFALAIPWCLALAVTTWRHFRGHGWRPLVADDPRGRAMRLALLLWLATMAGLLIMGARGAAVSVESRHQRLAALCLFPFLFEAVLAGARQGRLRDRALGLVLLLGIFVVPAAFGLGGLAQKAVGSSKSTRLVAEDDLRYEALGPRADVRSAFAELRRRFGGQGNVFYLERGMAVPLLPERILFENSSYSSVKTIKERKIGGLPRGRVVLVVPRKFAHSGRLAAIQGQFAGVRWQAETFPEAPDLEIWVGR